MSILTFKLKHGRNFDEELKQAYVVAEYGRKNKIRFPYAKDVNAVRGCLPANVTGQIMKKYGHQKTIKEVHNVNLIVTGRDVKFFGETNSIWIPCLKLHLENTIRYAFVKINQAEIDNEYVYISVSIEDAPEMTPKHFIGVDRNTTGHIAVAANPETGKIEKLGKKAIHTHRKYSAIRRTFQHDREFGKLKDCKNRESRIVRDLNHKVSRKLVSMAKEQNAALVFEDLGGIRQTRKQHRSFKYALHSWSFFQLQTFVEYKAKLLGVPVLYVDPAYTSQDCSRCGARGKRDKKAFTCPVCGHVDHADVNAAFNIALRQYDLVNRYQKEMIARGTLISPIALLAESQATLELTAFGDKVCQGELGAI